jgi:nicotinate phosphoribosyltransferase
MESDILTLEDDRREGEPLIQPVMHSGKRLSPTVPLAKLRERALAELSRLPENLRTIEPAQPYPVTVSPKLHELASEVDERQNRMDASAPAGLSLPEREKGLSQSVGDKPG